MVSVIFADLVGFTAASDGADPEDMRRRLGPYHEAIRQEVERYGGRIEKLMGDGVLAVFGAPVVHEDDAERAVRAGLRIQERIAEMAGASVLSARVAVGTGEAVVAIEGTTMDREGLVGDVVNTTSRLQHEAPPGTVLVDEPTHRATWRAFRYEERAPVVVRGKGEPLAVWIALVPTGRFGVDVEDDGASLVGRDGELRLLTNAFDRLIGEGASQIVTVGGEPGVGKSRMVRELRRHVDDLPDLTRWRQGRCLAYGEGVTFWALAEIVKAEAGILETDPPGTAVGKLRVSLDVLVPDSEERDWIASRLAPLVGSELEPSADKVERFAAWSRYVTALAEQRPTVIVFEDLHWAESALIEFISALPEAARGTPLLLVCTARPEFFEDHPTWGSGQRNVVTVRLEPLDDAATVLLLEELLAGLGLDADRRAAIATRSGGNPLWAQEFARMVRDRPETATDAGLPDSVQAVVAARIDLLDPDAKTVLQAAATVGKSFWSGAVAAMLPGQELDVDGLLGELSRRELVRRERISTMERETEYAFTHSVVRDVGYSQVPRRVRAVRHSRLARWIAAKAGDRIGDRATVIAHHDAEALRLAAATDLPDVTAFVDAAIDSHRLAARHAGALDTQVQRTHLDAALQLLPPGDRRRPAVVWEMAQAMHEAGLMSEATKFALEARSAFEEAGDLEGWGAASVLLASATWTAGTPDAAEAYLDEAITRLKPAPPGPALAEAYAQVAGFKWLRGDSQAAIDFIGPVRHVIEVHGSMRARGRSLSAEGGARFDLGDPSAVDSFRRTLAAAIEADSSFAICVAHVNLGEQLRTGWGPAEAIQIHEKGLEIARRRHVDGPRQFLLGSLAVDYALSMRWDEAMALLGEFDTLSETLPYMAATRSVLLTHLRPVLGETLSVGEVEEALAAAEAIRDLQAVVPAYDSATWAYELGGEDARALTCARAVVERSGASRFLLDAFTMPMRVLRRAGELDRVEAVLPELRRFAMPRPEALLGFADSLILERANPPAALAGLESAAEDLAGLGVSLEAVMVLSEAARVADDIGDAAAGERIRVRAQQLAPRPDASFLLGKLGLR